MIQRPPEERENEVRFLDDAPGNRLVAMAPALGAGMIAGSSPACPTYVGVTHLVRRPGCGPGEGDRNATPTHVPAARLDVQGFPKAEAEGSSPSWDADAS